MYPYEQFHIVLLNDITNKIDFLLSFNQQLISRLPNQKVNETAE